MAIPTFVDPFPLLTVGETIEVVTQELSLMVGISSWEIFLWEGMQETETGHSPSRPLDQRKWRKKQLAEEQSDFVGSLRNVDGMEDQDREGNFISSNSKVSPSEKLKEVQSDIDTLDNWRGQLEISMEEKVQEANVLTSRIEKRETQLQKEEEEAKRSQAPLQK